MSFVSSKGNILCRLVKIELYEIFAIINRAIKGLHCTLVRTLHNTLATTKYFLAKVVNGCEIKEVLQKTYKFHPLPGTVFTKSCLFFLS